MCALVLSPVQFGSPDGFQLLPAGKVGATHTGAKHLSAEQGAH